MPPKILTRTLTIVCLAGCLALCSCGNSKSGSSNEPVATQTAPAPAPSPKTEFETSLDFVRKGQYTYIWVLARKDGKVIDKDDANFLRTTAPQVVDWVTTDQGKRVIAGTNFDLAKGNLELLKKRFVVEDYTGK